MNVGFPDPKDFIYDISEKLAISYSQIRKDFPTWQDQDVRITTYSKCANVIESILFSWNFKNEQLSDPQWYDRIPYIHTPTPTQIKTTQAVYDSLLMISFVHWYIGTLEHFFRVLLKQINPESRLVNFYDICKYVLEYFELKEEYEKQFDIFRLLRNSMHNNGVITDRHAHPIEYDGVTYDFQLGRQIKNANWFMLNKVASELHDCLNKICRNEEISQILFIEDPSYFDVSETSYVSFELE